ncbi:hypothetical protein ACFTZI_23895 [Streptomyces decoyicus]|uniref:hypothetical protein n=1 Tax=Streptomyces decoyicus TaxID=249567 RepID=UPI003645C3CE
MSAGAVRLGRCVTVVGLPALVALTAGWLFLGTGPVRTAVVWAALTALAGCVLAVTGCVLGAGRVTPERAYELTLDAARVPAPGPGAAPPATLHGTRWTWARITALTVAVPTALMLFFSLGGGEADRSPTAGRIADSHYVIKELPVVAVGNVERAGSSRRASSTADYTVRLPSAHGGKTVPATFRTEVSKGVREVGDTFPVAYAPDQPQLGAVGAKSRSDVETQLAGRTLTQGSFFLTVIMWAVLGAVMFAVGTSIAFLPRGRRRVTPDWVALRATATGLAEHVEPPSDGDAKKGNKKSAARYQCLNLRTETGDVPLNLAASHKRAAPLLVGSEGWLLWNPAASKGKAAASKGKAAAEFVADAGWQLPGRVPAAEATRIAARPRGPVPLDAGRQVRLLELGSLWPRTVPVGVLLGLIVSVAAVGALLLPADGGWRAWAAVAGALAPFLVWMLGGLFTSPAKTPEPGVQAGGGPAV